jgi:hypothetical protein
MHFVSSGIAGKCIESKVDFDTLSDDHSRKFLQENRKNKDA